MKKKSPYRIRNWSEYNASLKQRGSGAIWVSSEATANWTTDELTGEPGASPTDTDLAIETMATVQAIYGLAGRQTQCFLQSVFELTKLDFKTIFGDRLQTRQIDNQFKELMLKSAILNRMTHLGMPDSVKVAG